MPVPIIEMRAPMSNPSKRNAPIIDRRRPGSASARANSTSQIVVSAEIVKWQGRREHYSLEGFPKFVHVSRRHIRVGANAVQAASRINGIGFAEMPTRISSFVFLTQMAAAAAPNTTPSVLAHTSDIDVTRPSTKYCASSKEEALFQYGRPEIFNTDQGSQFTSNEFTGTLERHEVTISMDGKGRYMDNIFVERLWRSLKYEEVYLNAYASVAEAKAGIGSWLDFYNGERQHQNLRYRTPRQIYEAEGAWIGGRSASPTGYAFAYIPTGTTANHRINVDEEEHRSNAMSVATSAIGAGREIVRATP